MEKKDSNFSYDSIFTYADESKKYDTGKNTFNSAFQYNNMQPGRQRGHLAIDVFEEPKEEGTSTALVVTTYVLTFLSYFFFVITLPITYWFFVKKMGEFDRVVVFRLGKMVGVKGPGRVIVFPWMDRIKKIDVRAAAFSVPPQQFITCDGGIVEMGADIQYGIVDVVTMVSEVADHQDILRSLSKTLLIKNLVKKAVAQIMKDRRRAGAEIQDEINLQVRKWGIDIQKVDLSEPKVLKQPENGGNTAVGSILKGLGMKSDPKYPTPEEFVRVSHGLEDENGKALPSHVSALGMGDVGGNNMNINLLQMMASGLNNQARNQANGFPGIVPPSEGPIISPDVCSWGRCLEVILQSEFSGPIDDEACGLYKLEITDTATGKDIYFISLSQDTKAILSGNETNGMCPDGRNPDVTVTISSPDLASVLEGTLAPLQAYLTGRISASGDMKKLMLFDKLSKRGGHKTGQMFSV